MKLFSFLDKDTQSNIEIKTSLANNSNLIKKSTRKGYCFLDNFFNYYYYFFLNKYFQKKYKFKKIKN